MTIRAMCWESARPKNCHVLPASVDLYRPFPEYDDRARSLAPVPIQTNCELEGVTATAPTAATSTLSEITSHVTPLFDVFHSPPLREAA